MKKSVKIVLISLVALVLLGLWFYSISYYEDWGIKRGHAESYLLFTSNCMDKSILDSSLEDSESLDYAAFIICNELLINEDLNTSDQKNVDRYNQFLSDLEYYREMGWLEGDWINKE